MLYAVILAGGSGTRLWPSSRRRRPKQAVPILGGKSLFQRAVDRVEGFVPPERIFVITSADQRDILASQAPRVPHDHVIGEPMARDSSAAIFLAAAITGALDPDAINLVMTADHLISPVERFQEAAARAVALAEKGHLVTFGIKPTRPATGYGYVERGEALDGAGGAFEVARFTEKPDGETAAAYISDGRHYWNSGMFVWKASQILDAAKKHAPAHFAGISPLGEAFGGGKFDEAVARAYEPLEKISIDFAVMEKADNLAVVEGDFDWSDVGSHTALKEFAPRGENGNVCLGLTEVLDSSGSVVVSEDDHLVAVFGCDDMVVIHTPDATLVCPAARAEELKKLIAAIERRAELEDYL